MAGPASQSSSITDPFEFDSDNHDSVVSIFKPNVDDVSTPKHRRSQSSPGNQDGTPAWVGPLLARLAKIEDSVCRQDRTLWHQLIAI